MHRYSTATGGSGVGSSRDNSRSDPTFAAARRTVQLAPYKLKCEKEQLNSRLGAPDFYAPAPDCAEECLTRETCQRGYKESIEGIEENRETVLSLAGNSALWAKENINRYKESLRKRLRAVTNALIRKRKAGQVYNVPLAGNLLAKPGYFPERHTCGEDFRKKWIEDLSQRKRLQLLAEHVPHGFHRKTLFEALIKQKVPFLRATWFIKVSYLNQVRPSSIGNSVGVADKSQAKRFEQWTRDFLEYAQSVLDELCISSSSQLGSVEPEPDGHAKWDYIVRLVQWQYAEGLLQQSHVVDWALKQIQEKESLDALELLLPVIMEFMDAVSQSQVHVRVLVVDICLYWLRQIGATNSLPSAEEQPQQHRVAVTLIELLRYLLVSVPDTFVAFDCFPFLPCVFALEGESKKEEVTKMTADKTNNNNNNKTVDTSPYREVFIMEVVDSIQKRASSLTKAVNPGVLRNNEGKVIQELDKSLAAGDIYNAYHFVFNIDFSGYEQLPGEWKNANSNLPFLSGMLNNANLSDLFAVRFLCEWAICDFRDTRKLSSCTKTLCVKELARIYFAASVLSLKRSEIEANSGAKRSKGRATKEKRSAIHEIVVAWIDQHEVRKGEGMQKMQLLLFELVRKGIFHPHTYVRQLIVEGVLERRETPTDIARAARHRRILRYLPGPPFDSTEDISEHVRLYRNERRLALQASSEKTKQLRKQGKVKSTKLLEVKQAVSAYFQIPDCTQKVPNVPVKRAAETLGCEDCTKNKRQKTNEGKVYMGIPEAEGMWWLKKIPKVNDTLKLEPTVKPTIRGSRPKTVRKRQSLAQLHNSTRLDTSQGASSSSNPADTKVHCPYHKPGNKVGSTNEIKMRNDLRNIGLALKQLTVSDKYMFSRWLDRTIRNLVGDGKSVQLSEEQFGAVVYMLDTVLDYYTLVSLLLWLLPLVGVYGRTGVLKDTVGEHAVLSCLRRYELPITSLNLLSEVLMQCASSFGGSLALHYASELFNKYKGLTTIQTWQRTYQKTALELEALKGGDSEGALGFMGMPNSVSEDRDDPIPQRLNSRLARIAVSMKDGVLKGLAEASAQIIHREREPSSTSLNFTSKDSTPDKIVAGLLDSIKQNGSPQTDSGLLNAAVTAIVNSAMSSATNAYEQLTGVSNIGGAALADSPAFRCVRRILQLHVRCLRLLKEGLDDRQSRLLEFSLASEASAIVSGHFVHNRPVRSQFHLSPETPELGVFAENLASNQNSLASLTRLASASALLIKSVLYGVVGLERLVSVLKIKDGLEQLQLPKLLYGSNGNLSRSSNVKQDSLLEGYIHWFRALLGDCRGVAGGLLADFLGEANVSALFRTQRLLSLSTVFPPAYAMFCGLLRRQVLSRMSILSREEGILHSLACAVSDMVKHEPFREVCLQDTKALHVLFSQDVGASEYAGLLDEQGLDVRTKIEAMLPFSARLFLHALLDGVVVTSMEAEDTWMENVRSNRQVEQMVHILDELQPATFHWQWLELRLLLNEQVFVEKIDAQSSAVKAMQASVGGTEQPLSECEKSFTEKVLTGLLYRPDAGALYSEVLHCLGKPLEEYLIKLVTWTLQGHDLLFARKSLRQKLDKGYPKGTSNLKSWGWQPPGSAGDVEEGEVSTQERCLSREEGACLNQHFATEKALADLVLPCLARSLNETCTGFASNLVQQMAELEQQVTSLTRSNGRLSTVSTTQVDGPTKSQASRRGARGGLEGGSPGVRRRPTVESSPVSAAALQSSMWLRLQFLLPLLRIVYSDRDANSAKNMRITLATVLLRLLGTRIVQESAESFGIIHQQQDQSNREGQWNAELASVAAAAAAGEELFDRLLSVLHALLSNTWAVWLKPRGRAAKSPREVPPFDRDAADRMQTELDHMHLPRSLRTRLQAAMPVFPPGPVFAVSAAPPQVPIVPFTTLTTSQKPLLTDLKTNSMDSETSMDPWLLLEDGTGVPGSVGTSGAGGDGGPLRACPWLKGAVRVRRTDLTYAASVDSTDT